MTQNDDMNDPNEAPSEEPRRLFPNELAERTRSNQPDADRPWQMAFRLNEVEPGAVDRLAKSPATETFAHEVVIGDRIIAVFFHAGHWYAIDGMCAHQGGPLAKGHVADGCVTCPWHGWQYELATGTQTINRQPLQETFSVRQVGGVVEIQLG